LCIIGDQKGKMQLGILRMDEWIILKKKLKLYR